jgi:putative PIN family toxin of toxin-antitoxin system
MALRVVLDTSVWISAALSPNGPPAAIVRLLLARGVPVLTQATFDELCTRLAKPKFDRWLGQDLRQKLLRDLDAAALWVTVPDSMAATAWSRDRSDDAFVHAALVSGAAWLVSGDADLLAIMQPPPGLRIVTPAEALVQLPLGA